MAVFKYTWGTERPGVKEQRHLLNKTVRAEERRLALRAQYEAALAEVDRDVEAEDRELEIIRLSTPGGRYNSDVAAAVAAQFGISGSDASVKRGRGRPRKYGPGDARPARPSRAKTPAGRLRAASMQFAGGSKRKSATRQNSEMVSPVTASPARAVAPKAAAEIGRALLTGTIAAQQDVVAPIDVDIVVTDGAIVAETGANSAEQRLDFAAIAALHEESFKRAADELSGDELSDDGVQLLSNLLHSHRVQHHQLVQWVRGQDGAPMLPYDFSDAMDEGKASADVRPLFKGFGLSLHETPSAMPEVDMRAWIERTMFDDVPDTQSEVDQYAERYGSCQGIYRKFIRKFDREFERERARVRSWPTIERRLAFVERTNQLLARGEIDRDTALARVARVDFLNLDFLPPSAHSVYREIVDAMTWFDGFSRLDIADWSGHDPAKVPLCKVQQGFPAWTFPKRLHEAVFNGHMFESAPEFEYEVPSIAELVEFASVDKELIIANLRERGVDYSKIDL